jgi:hypothetical protein
MPRHSICSRWVDHEPVAKRTHASVKPVPSLTGVRSPPLREMAKRWGQGLPGADLEMARKVVFSEGRTLCVREYGSGASRGIT